MRRLFFLLLLLGSPALHAEPGFISRLLNHPVPGGVAVVPLGSGAKAPAVRYQDKPVLVVQEDGKTWIAIVGIPLKSAPGPHQVTTSDGRTLSFKVGTKHYREQHIKLKNSRQVNPLAEDMTRINRELPNRPAPTRPSARLSRATCCLTSRSRARSPAPSGCAASSTARSATPTPASTSRSEPALPSRHQPLARSSSSATTSSTAIRCSSTTARASSACSVTCRRWT